MEIKVLGVDPGLTTAIAYDDKTAVWNFNGSRKRSLGDCLNEFREKLKTLISDEEIDVLAIEQPIPKNRTSAMIQFGMFGVALEAATSLDLAYRVYNPMTIRTFARRFCEEHTTSLPEPPPEIPLAKQNSWQMASLVLNRRDLTHDEADAVVIQMLCESECCGKN